MRNDPVELEKLVENYETTLSDLINQHAPINKRRMKIRQQAPWYNEGIAEAETESRKEVEEIEIDILKKKKNTVTFIMNKARKEFYVKFYRQEYL